MTLEDRQYLRERGREIEQRYGLMLRELHLWNMALLDKVRIMQLYEKHGYIAVNEAAFDWKMDEVKA